MPWRRLCFGPALDVAMQRLATEYVEVRGQGSFDDGGEWSEVRVEELNETRSRSEPFDLDAFLNDPNPRVFDPEGVAPIDLTDEEFESFVSTIRAEGRAPATQRRQRWRGGAARRTVPSTSWRRYVIREWPQNGPNRALAARSAGSERPISGLESGDPDRIRTDDLHRDRVAC